jgi:sulfur-carrier protein
MKVSVLYFAKIKEIVGLDEEDILIEGNLKDLLVKVSELHPMLLDIIESIINKSSDISVALNACMVSELGSVLSDNDEVAFIPPISGG